MCCYLFVYWAGNFRCYENLLYGIAALITFLHACVIVFLSSYVFTGPPALTVDIIENARDLSVVLQWDEVDNSLPTDYTVTWTNGSTPIQSNTLIEQSSYTITGLTLDTVYNISVFAANECGQGPVHMTNISFSAGTCANTCVPLLLVLALVLYIYIICSNYAVTMEKTDIYSCLILLTYF